MCPTGHKKTLFHQTKKRSLSKLPLAVHKKLQTTQQTSIAKQYIYIYIYINLLTIKHHYPINIMLSPSTKNPSLSIRKWYYTGAKVLVYPVLGTLSSSKRWRNYTHALSLHSDSLWISIPYQAWVEWEDFLVITSALC